MLHTLNGLDAGTINGGAQLLVYILKGGIGRKPYKYNVTGQEPICTIHIHLQAQSSNQ